MLQHRHGAFVLLLRTRYVASHDNWRKGKKQNRIETSYWFTHNKPKENIGELKKIFGSESNPIVLKWSLTEWARKETLEEGWKFLVQKVSDLNGFQDSQFVDGFVYVADSE